jgi:ABC-type phosphate/phosphonate transport system substrate-binding protein
MIAPLSREGKFFSQVRISGAHVSSIEMLLRSEVDVACIDCVTWGLIGRFRPALLEGLSVISQTPHAPAPPYVISMRYGRVFARKIQNALVHVMNNPQTAGIRNQLGMAASR